jgi:hypothetical protein
VSRSLWAPANVVTSVAIHAYFGEATASLRSRMQVTLRSPALQAQSTIWYRAWRDVVSRFAAGRLRFTQDTLISRTLGHLGPWCALAAYDQWLSYDDSDLPPLSQGALAVLTETHPSDAQRISNLGHCSRRRARNGGGCGWPACR